MQIIIRQSENHTPPTYQWLGEQEYTSFLEKMQRRCQRIQQQQASETIYFCQHQAVYTTGKRGINNSKRNLRAPFIITERGGETTFHGKGQLMMYPILNLKQQQITVRQYIHILEQSCIDLLSTYGIQAQRDCGLPGVWVKQAKIAALGVRITQGITSHGIALNVSTDLSYFDNINPCGTSRKATSIANITTINNDLENIAKHWYPIFKGLL